jgi:DNA-binding NtrC family response regulator
MADRADDATTEAALRTGGRSGAASRAEFARLNLVGQSPPFLESLQRIRKIASCDVTVLIEGETGTGKELAARAVHYLGARRNAPFIPINCGAIPETLVESELFGHARGAFTDAREARQGVIAQAEGGTLFLDEIEAMTLRAQVALLRFLHDHEYRPVGGVQRAADVRIIGASNAQLADCVSRGTFRQDLLFRLNVLTLTLPPLRARGDDVLLLAESFLTRFCQQYQKPPKQLDAHAVTRLREYSWPGNVRELENLIQREVLLTEGPTLDLESVRATPAEATASPAAASFIGKRYREAKAAVIASFEKAYVTEVLSRTRGNISEAARLCGKERSRLGKLAKKHGLEPSLFHNAPSDSPG